MSGFELVAFIVCCTTMSVGFIVSIVGAVGISLDKRWGWSVAIVGVVVFGLGYILTGIGRLIYT